MTGADVRVGNYRYLLNQQTLINELVQYGVRKHLVEEDDRVYVTNRLLELFGQM